MGTLLYGLGVFASILLLGYLLMELWFKCKTRWMRRITKLADQSGKEQ